VECYLCDGRVTAGGRAMECYLFEAMECYLFDGRVTAGGAMECYLFDGSHGMLFLGCEVFCCDPVLVEVPIPAQT
jgi:hypothetical protein